MEIRMLPYPYDAYHVSADGRVFSTKRGWSEMLQTIDAKGYANVSIMSREDRRRSKRFRVHTLVLTAFSGQRSDNEQCRHIDGNKLNNAIENLTWDTASANQIDNVIHGVHPTMKLTPSDVMDMRAAYANGGITHKELAAKYGISRKAACDIVAGRRWAHLPGAVSGKSNRVVTKEQAEEIRGLYATGEYTYAQLATMYGFKTPAGVYQIVKGTNHK